MIHRRGTGRVALCEAALSEQCCTFVGASLAYAKALYTSIFCQSSWKNTLESPQPFRRASSCSTPSRIGLLPRNNTEAARKCKSSRSFHSTCWLLTLALALVFCDG